AKKTTMFVDGPEVCRAVPACLKNEILSVRRPLAAAFVGSLVPTWKERMKIAAIRGSLPDRAVIGLGIVYREAQNRSVRRPANIARGPTRIQELMWFASIAPRNEYFVAFAINDLLAVRRPRSRVAFKIPQAPRRTAKHRHTPKRAVERSASGRIHQKCGTIRRNIEHISEAGVFQGIGHRKCLAARHRSLGKARLPLDEVKPRTVSHDVRFRPVRVRELDSSQHPWRRHTLCRNVAKNYREGDERAAH